VLKKKRKRGYVERFEGKEGFQSGMKERGGGGILTIDAL